MIQVLHSRCFIYHPASFLTEGKSPGLKKKALKMGHNELNRKMKLWKWSSVLSLFLLLLLFFSSSLSEFVISICETKLHPYLLSQFYGKLLWCLEWLLKPTPEAMQILRKYICPCFFHIYSLYMIFYIYFAWSDGETRNRKTVPILNFNAKCKWVKKEKISLREVFRSLTPAPEEEGVGDTETWTGVLHLKSPFLFSSPTCGIISFVFVTQ